VLPVAAALAMLALYRERVGSWLARALRPAVPVVGVLRSLHSGVVGDYVAWLTFGAAALGGLVALAVR
jgi:hypothetical protein